MKLRLLLLISAGLQFALLVPLARWASKHPHPHIDIHMTHFLQKKDPPFLRYVILGIEVVLCSVAATSVLVVPLGALLWRMRLRLEALMIAATCWISGLARFGIKHLVDRPRPNPLFVNVTKQSKGKSFPSGDVSSTMVVWGWLFALGLLQKKSGGGLPRGLLLSVPELLVALVGPARVYLGDHWSSDVLGGYLYGGGWLALSVSLYLYLREWVGSGSLT